MEKRGLWLMDCYSPQQPLFFFSFFSSFFSLQPIASSPLVKQNIAHIYIFRLTSCARILWVWGLKLKSWAGSKPSERMSSPTKHCFGRVPILRLFDRHTQRLDALRFKHCPAHWSNVLIAHQSSAVSTDMLNASMQYQSLLPNSGVNYIGTIGIYSFCTWSTRWHPVELQNLIYSRQSSNMLIATAQLEMVAL